MEQMAAIKFSRFNPVDIALFLRALVHARTAQRVREVPVGEVVAAHARRGGGGGGHPVHRVELAVRRAIWRWRRCFGGIDSCLTRSLASNEPTGAVWAYPSISISAFDRVRRTRFWMAMPG